MPVNQASEVNRLWWVRAQNWAEGAGQTPYETVNRTPEIVAASDAKWRDLSDVLPDPNNYHSNPGYMGTSTASSGLQATPGAIYRTAGPKTTYSSGSVGYQGGRQGHRPMTVGGPSPQRAPGRTVSPAPGDREPISEGSPLVVQTGQAQF